MKLALTLTHPIQIIMGLIIWSHWFVGMYAGLSLGCMVAPAPETLGPLSWINVTLLVFTLLVAFLLLVLAVRCWRRPVPAGDDARQHKFTLRVAAAVYFASAGATLAVGLPTIALPPCI